MGEHTKKWGPPRDGRPAALGELIHVAVRRAIEVAVDEELTAALGAPRYERCGRAGAAIATASSRGRSPGRRDPWLWRCRGPRCSRRRASGNGPRACSPGTSGGGGR